GVAQACRVRQHGIEDGLQFSGRTTDYAEHLRGRRLLVQCLGEVSGALLQLVEQAGGLDGGDGLRGKIRHQLDLLLGERAHFLAVDGDRAKKSIFLEHWHADRRASAAEIGQSDEPWIAFEIRRRRPNVVDLNRPLGPENLRVTASRMGTEWHILHRGKRRRYVVNRSDTKYVPVIQVHRAELGTAKPCCVR